MLRSGALPAGVLLAALLAGCSTGAPAAAPSATTAACTAALARLPSRVLDRARSALDVAGAAAWGDPQIVLRCGLPEPGPTSLDCLSVDDVDWVVDLRADPLVFTTFGRAPAVEVRVPTSYGRQNASAALADLADVARALPKTAHRCVGPG